MLNIYVVRHGETEFNKKGLIMGQIDSELTDKGVNQALVVGKILKEIKFDIIYSSNLNRALHTAKLIQSKLKYPVKIKTSKKLLEVNYGFFSGKLKLKITKNFNKYHKDINFVNPGGESFNHMNKRILKFLKKINLKYSHMNSNILIVTHAGCIRSIYSFFREESLQNNMNLKIKHTSILKCELEKNIKRAKFLHN